MSYRVSRINVKRIDKENGTENLLVENIPITAEYDQVYLSDATESDQVLTLKDALYKNPQGGYYAANEKSVMEQVKNNATEIENIKNNADNFMSISDEEIDNLFATT